MHRAWSGLAVGAAVVCVASVARAQPVETGALLEEARAADEAHAAGRAIDARERLLALPAGAHTAPTLRALAASYAAVGDFERAADALERYAALADDTAALVEATRYRLALGDAARATEDVARLVQRRAVDGRGEATEVALEVAQRHEEQRAWRDAEALYRALLRALPRGARDARVRAQVGVGRALAGRGEATGAEEALRAAVAVWSGQAPPRVRLQSFMERAREEARREAARLRAMRRRLVGGGMAGGASGIVSPFGGMTESGYDVQDASGEMVEDAPPGSVRDAVAEARFRLMEPVFAWFAAQQWPPYEGPASRSAYDRWAQEVLQPFIREAQRFLNEEFTREYTAIVNLHAPRWEVAAYARLAEAFATFARWIQTAPSPPDVARNPDLLDAWRVMQDRYDSQFVDVARVGYERCVAQATRVRYVGEWSRRCEEGLAAIDRSRYPLPDEPAPAPTLVVSRPAVAAPERTPWSLSPGRG